MDWESVRKILKASVGEPASQFTGTALAAMEDGWEEGRTSRDSFELLKSSRQEPGRGLAGLVGEEQDWEGKRNTVWERNRPCSGAWHVRWAEIRD